MAGDAFPTIRTKGELHFIPIWRHVECAAATCHDDTKDIDDGTNPYEWALKHVQLNPGHDRFRVRSVSNFRVLPGDGVVS
jgi:hypothetical protein